MTSNVNLSTRDLRSLERVLRFVNTADSDVQAEAFRLAQKIRRILHPPKK
jgi:hypothetical protein